MRPGLTGLLIGRWALATFVLCRPLPSVAQEDLRVFGDAQGGRSMAYVDAPNALYHYLAREAAGHLERRASMVSTLRTANEWRERQAEVRRTLLDVVGPFPTRTPLKPRITGVLRKDGYRVEKLIYESRPNSFVTGALFIPDSGQRPAPAIIYFSGHTSLAFRAAPYQTLILNLVRKGFVVLAIDPVGQGERLQYLDPSTTENLVGANTLEHSYAGAQLFLTGGSLAREMIWDGIRAIDYLTTRPEVDPSRIGVTGRSGGGTQASFVAAFDMRVRAAAPENFLVSLRRLWETLGPQDAEQNFFHGIARGLDHADLLVARAPLPTLVIATTRDIFNIHGAREMFAEARTAYAGLGAPESLRMVEDDAGHESTRKNREATYAFFQETLSLPGSPRDDDVEPLPPESLQVTPTGQLSTSLGGETPFSLNRAAAIETAEQRKRLRDSDGGTPAVVQAARTLSGYRDPGAAPEPLFMGRFRRAGYAVEKYILQSEGGYPIPFLLMVPDGTGARDAVVYVHPAGKAAEAGPGGEMERLVRRGYLVAAPDLAGTGEMGSGAYRGDSYGFRPGPAPYGLWFGSVLLGRSLAGIHAGDLVRLVRAIQRRPDVRADRIRAVSRGEAGSALLHAAAFEPAISGVALLEPLVSYSNLVATRYYQPRFIPAGVAGMLRAYDLPDLAAAVAPRPLVLVNVLNAAGAVVGREALREELSVVHAAFTSAGVADRLAIRQVTASTADVLGEWLSQEGPARSSPANSEGDP